MSTVPTVNLLLLDAGVHEAPAAPADDDSGDAQAVARWSTPSRRSCWPGSNDTGRGVPGH